MHIKPIRSVDDHREALREIDRLWGAAPGSSDGDRLDVLVALVERYEDERFPITVGEPAEVVREVMAQNGYSQADLGVVLGSKSRASELLSGKREISLDQIRKLSRAWRIPPAALIGGLA